MTKRHFIIWFLLFSFLEADFNETVPSRTIPLKKLFQTDLVLKNRTFKVWLAIDPKQKKEGLSSLLADEVSLNNGMLFLYPYEEKLSFWMKDTFFDLDIVYIKKDGTIIDIYTMPKQSLKLFTSSSKVSYALELRAGEFEKLGLKVGDRIEFSSIIKSLTL